MTLYITIYVLIALSAAIAGVLGLFVASRGVEHLGSKGTLTFYLWMLLFAPAVRIMTAPREYLDEAGATLAEYTAISGPVTWLLRLSSLAIVGVAVVVILGALIKRQKYPGGRLLGWGLLAMFVASMASSIFGAKPGLIHQTLYTFMLLASLMLMPPISPGQVAIQAKRVLVLFMFGSLALALVYPNQYVQVGYDGLIPGFSIRLHGLASHANSLAPLALLYLILAYWVPGKKPWHALGIVAALAVLVLTQSKTIWLTGLLILSVLVAAHLKNLFNLEMRNARIGWATVTMLGAFLTVPILFAVLFSGAVDGLTRNLMTDSDLTSLTGRTTIWQITIDTWLRDPWFGYGPNLWDLEFRIAHNGALAAWHAHNQFLQILGMSGVVGIVALLLYLGAIVFYCIRFSRVTRGVTLALLLLLLTRSMTEVPISFLVLLDATFFVHVVVFATITMLARQGPAVINHELRAQQT